MSLTYSTWSEPTSAGLTVDIVEQPCKSVRYRYEKEQRHSIIFGASTNEQKTTYFTIKIRGYKGLVDIVIYSVTNEIPYKKHPSKLQGPRCHNGYFLSSYNITKQPQTVAFPELRLVYLKHQNNRNNNNSAVLKLCVEVTPKHFDNHTVYVYSNPIYNKQKISDLKIRELSHDEIPVDKIPRMILLCEKVFRNDVKIRFIQIENDQVKWKDYGEFTLKDVHKQSAISFRPPQYPNTNITKPVTVAIQLERTSTNEFGPPLTFKYLPGKEGFERKVYELMKEVGDLGEFQAAASSLSCSAHDPTLIGVASDSPLDTAFEEIQNNEEDF